jgi:hypothetical protein
MGDRVEAKALEGQAGDPRRTWQTPRVIISEQTRVTEGGFTVLNAHESHITAGTFTVRTPPPTS